MRNALVLTLAAALAAIAVSSSGPAQAGNRWPVVPQEVGVRPLAGVGWVPWRCSDGPVLNLYHDAWYDAPPAVYLGIHVIEGELVTPMLVAHRFTLNPVLVIGSLIFWEWMWGIPGALLAVPMLAVTKIICDRVRPLTPIGHFLGG